MAKLSLNIFHELPKEEALKRIKGLLTKLKTEQGDIISDVKEEWNNDKGNFAFSAKGFDLSGAIQVTESGIDIDARLPFAVSLFSDKIKKIITEQAASLLAK
jgi:hypothetical protein